MTVEREVTDVVVIGAGPAGIAAAARAAESGARVMVIDEGVGPGGQIWRPAVGRQPSSSARQWLARLAASGATMRGSTSVVDVCRNGARYDVMAESRGRAQEIRTAALILATGARERLLPFPGWTLPNVVGIGAAQALLKTGTSFRDKRVVVAGTGPLMLPVAASLSHAGANVMLVAEQASAASLAAFISALWRRPSTLVQAAVLRAAFLRTAYATGTWVTEARGDTAVREVTLTNGTIARSLECDVLCAAFGLVPNVELARLLGCTIHSGAVVVNGEQSTDVPHVYCCGEPTGIGGVELALVEGEIAGLAAAGKSAPSTLDSRRARLRDGARRLERAFALRRELFTLANADTIVCRCEDVRLGELDPRWTTRQAKLFTRAGMGPCQGRICGAALECLMEWPADAVRLPTQPARLSTLAGDSTVVQQSREQGAH
jgi:NADPH-dependent 2,4-dienoyl-CoA reductase/sulfur reductase-like enzyme